MIFRGIRESTTPLNTDPAEKLLGRLESTLHYAEPTEVQERGIREDPAQRSSELLRKVFGSR